jgi:hypothetical protein
MAYTVEDAALLEAWRKRIKLKLQKETQTCSICQKEFTGYDNNAWPVNDGRCCYDCNETVAVPARMNLMFKAA